VFGVQGMINGADINRGRVLDPDLTSQSGFLARLLIGATADKTLNICTTCLPRLKHKLIHDVQ
jgi:hypothetical protein